MVAAVLAVALGIYFAVSRTGGEKPPAEKVTPTHSQPEKPTSQPTRDDSTQETQEGTGGVTEKPSYNSTPTYTRPTSEAPATSEAPTKEPSAPASSAPPTPTPTEPTPTASESGGTAGTEGAADAGVTGG